MNWLSKLKDNARKNNSSRENTLVQCASLRADGSPKIHQLVFRDFMGDFPLIIFTGSIRQPEIISLMKSKSSHDLLWNFPSETFTLTGKIYLVCSPNQAHRLGTPSRRILSVPEPEIFWEKERYRHWQSISKYYRATFTWPVSGETVKPPESANWSAYKNHNVVKRSYGMDVGYKYASLDALPVRQRIPSVLANEKPTAQQELENVHEMAFENFCLFVFKCDRVEHWVNKQVPIRTIYDINENWSAHEVTP
jgi:hypothetical protein